MRSWAAGLLAAGAAAAVLLLSPGQGLAWHSNQNDWDGLNASNPSSPALVCTSCHTLSTSEGEPGTSYINSSSRTLPLMKAYNGGSVPGAFGCTYCHNTPTNTRMRGVLNHFTSGVSKHPVGKNFVSGLDTNNEYLSGNASNHTNETDCLDCHDVTLIDNAGTESAVSHATPPAANPFMLKSVTVLNEYDNFCRTCHGQGATFKGQSTEVTSHADAGTGRPIVEDDGTQLRPTVTAGNNKCRACHDTHYSGKAVLFNDGHEGDTAIVSTNCTAVCHYPGDDDNYVSASDNNYMNHGHGMAQSTYKYAAGVVNYTSGSYVTMGITCTGCHNQIDTSDTSASRRSHVTTPTAGTIQENYKGRFNLDNLPMQAGDTASMFGNPLWGICFTCHPSYEQHRTQVATDQVGCQDCHDEHAEGSGAGSNYFMIPETSKPQGNYSTTYAGGAIKAKAGSEQVIYAVPRLNPTTGAANAGTADFFNESPVNSGVCDNGECHATGGFTPLSTFMSGGSHSGGNQSAGADCESCHGHNGDPEGGWRASASCSKCHGTEGANAYPDGSAYPDTAGKHLQHVTAIAAANGLSTTDTSTCNWCHPNPGAARGGTTGETNHTDNYPPGAAPADLHGDGRAGAPVTHFKDIAGVADTGDSVTINTSCNNVNCHYNTTVTIADWYGSPSMSCAFCHASDVAYTAGQLPKAHDKHVDEVADGGYDLACTACHPDYGSNWAHQDGNVAGDVVFTGVPWGNDGDEGVTGGNDLVKYGTGVVGNYYGCAGISCHGDFPGGNNGTGGTTTNAPNWFNTGVSGDGRCGTCHGTTTGPAPAPNNTDGTPKANKHPKHVASNGFGCQVCHNPVTTDGTTIGNRSLHANGATDVDDDGSGSTLDALTYAAGTCSSTNCHGGGTIAWSAGTQTCDVCHQRVGGATTNSDVNSFTWDGTAMSKVSASEYTANGGGHGDNTAPNQPNKACSACHDSAVNHDTSANLTGANPFRLVDQDGGTAGLQFNCTNTAVGCHVAGTTGPRTGGDISTFDTHSPAGMLSGGYTTKRTWPAAFKPRCTDCHDPHGDGGGNLSMIQKELYDKGSFIGGVGTGTEQWGVPATTNDRNDLVFSDDTTGASAAGNSYGDLDLDFSSICQECHEDASMVSWHDGATTSGAGGTASGANHPTPGGNPTDCTACHPHDGGFKPSGCSGCHGDGANAYWPDTPATIATSYPDRAGRHLKHMNVLAARFYTKTAATLTGSEQQYICDLCHNDSSGVGGSSHADYVMPADVGAFNRMWGATPPTVPPADAGTAAGYAAATYSGSTWTGGSTCSGIDCHDEKTTGAGFEWYGATASTCTLCHSRATTGSNPSSGLHYGSTAPTVTGTWHDDTLGSGCTTCHTSLPATYTPTSTHVNGTFTGNGSIAGDRTNMGLFASYTNGGSDNVGTCVGGTASAAGCHDGPGELTWTRRWDSSIHYGSGDTPCAGCHGGMGTLPANDWTFGTGAHTLGDNNVEHGYNLWDSNAAADVIGKHSGSTNQTVRCKICHAYPATPYVVNGNGQIGWVGNTANDSTYHGNDQVEMNNTLGYKTSNPNQYGCTTNCHVGGGIWTMEGGGWTVNLINGPSVSCDACHDGSGTAGAATTVQIDTVTPSNSSPHTRINRTTWATACTQCHPGGATRGAMHAKNSDANVIAIPNYTVVGINYSHVVDGVNQGFVLGGESTTGQTEADICWNCHAATSGTSTVLDSTDPNEWGTNTNLTGISPNPSGINYNYGTLNQLQWIGASWTSAQSGGNPDFSYKTGLINPDTSANAKRGSIHTANPSGTPWNGPTANYGDTVAQIRCSYCHDVHNLNRASGDTFDNAPYLRGSWVGSAYKEDGAPRSGQGFTDISSWGQVPRASSSSTQLMGGYWIDVNSPNANQWTADQFGGLCALCHAQTKGGSTWSAGDLAAINQFGDMTDWVSNLNGHANTVKGATRNASAGRNIFDGRGGTSAVSFDGFQHFQGQSVPGSSGSEGFRGVSGMSYQPLLAATRPCKYNSDEWGVDETGATIDSNFHQFTCSKCHMPHASRLPRLMKTNCLDTRHNTWDDSYQVSTVGTASLNRTVSNFSSSQNCHSVGSTSAGARDTTYRKGWNNVTPW